MHRAGPGIERGIMVARRLVDLLRIGGELVVEAVEIDALAPLDQPFHVGPAEIEMPEQRIEQNLVPVADARQRRIDHHPFGDARGILRRQRIAHHVADIVGDEVGLLDLQRIHHAGDVQRLVLLGVAGVGMRRQAHAAQVRHDDGVILRSAPRPSAAHMSPVSPKPCSRPPPAPGRRHGRRFRVPLILSVCVLNAGRKWRDGRGGRDQE